MTRLNLVAAFELVSGLGIFGLWTLLLAIHQVPEIAARDHAIWFHLAAEYLLASTLIVGGLGLWLTEADAWAIVVASVAAGGLVYSTINSSGYYARNRRSGIVTVFAFLTLLGIISVAILAMA